MDIEDPIVVRSKLVPSPYYGLYYPGEPYVFINYWISDERAWETEVHETVHYILWNLKPWVRNCEQESVARALTALILNTEYDHSWWIRYGCENPNT